MTNIDIVGFAITTACIKKKHQEAINQCKDKAQTKLCFPTSQAGPSTSTGATGKITGMINYGGASLESEILWLAKSACSNYTL